MPDALQKRGSPHQHSITIIVLNAQGVELLLSVTSPQTARVKGSKKRLEKGRFDIFITTCELAEQHYNVLVRQKPVSKF